MNFYKAKNHVVNRVACAVLSVLMLGSTFSPLTTAFAATSPNDMGLGTGTGTVADGNTIITDDVVVNKPDGITSDLSSATDNVSNAQSAPESSPTPVVTPTPSPDSSNSGQSDNGGIPNSSNGTTEDSNSSSNFDSSSNSTEAPNKEPTETPESTEAPEGAELENGENAGDSVDGSTNDTETTDEFVVLGIVPVENYSLTAEIGDKITLISKLNRDDVLVSYQWQKLYLGENSVKSNKAIHEYNGGPTFYNFAISDTTETEFLAEDGGRTWPGIELYYAAKTVLENIGEDTSKLTFAWKTRNFALEGFEISADNADGTVQIYAKKDTEKYTATLNEDGEFVFGEAETVSVEQDDVFDESHMSHMWKNIEGATSDEYVLTLDEKDYETKYRCVVTILDEDYKAKCLEILKKDNNLPSEEQLNSSQVIYTPNYSFENKYSEEKITETISWYTAYEMLGGSNIVGNPKLSSDAQWITGLTNSYEYITKDTYDRVSKWLSEGKIDEKQADRYWTGLLSGGFSSGATRYANVLDENGFPTGDVRVYRGFDLTNGMLEVNSEWYGKTVYFRTDKDGKENWKDTGTAIKIPAYTDITVGDDGSYVESSSGTRYKKAIVFLNPYVYDTGSMYREYIQKNTTSALDPRGEGWLTGTKHSDMHIKFYDITADEFNKDPKQYMMDAEGNYRVDSVGWGVCTSEEPDISGKSYWTLKDFISNGYGFIVGHDTLYAYAGSYYDNFGYDLNESDIDPNDGNTWYYNLNQWVPGMGNEGYRYEIGPDGKPQKIDFSRKHGGHYYINELMGSNAGNVRSGTTSPSDAPSEILSSGGSHGYYGKNTLYGSDKVRLVQKGYSESQAESNPKYRTPVNFPYGVFSNKNEFNVDITHTNGQFAFGPIWVDYPNNKFGIENMGTTYPEPIVHTIDGSTGTNNFYLTGSGNFLMNQIGHLPTNKATTEEAELFTNSVFYVSQRKQCEICAANQHGQENVHFVHRVSETNANEILKALQQGGTYWYPIDDCYMLVDDITLPEDWTPIKGFKGHWNSDVYEVRLNTKGTPLLANDKAEGSSGWNLGTDQNKGVENVFDGNMTRTTGVARVVGELNSLFGTQNVNYAGYTVKIFGKDNPKYILNPNEVYSCTVNTDSKYVISNLPCIYDKNNKTGILNARVYDTAGREVTEYGNIRVNVAKEFWNNDMTIPLYLGAFSAEPVRNVEAYESTQAKFVANGYSDEAVQVSRWEYRTNPNGTWQTVPTEWNIDVSNQTGMDGDVHVITSTLTLRDVNPAWNGYEFRAVFTNNSHGEWNTYGYYWKGAKASNNNFEGASYKVLAKTNYFGQLNVKLWPVYTEQGNNVEVYEGHNATFTSKAYSLADDTKITAEWQYSVKKFNPAVGDYYDWYKVAGSNEFGHKEEIKTNTVKDDVINQNIRHILDTYQPDTDINLFKQTAKFYETNTSLTVNKVDIDQNGLRFRVKYTATTKYGTKYEWYSDMANDVSGKWVNKDLTACDEVLNLPESIQNHSNILTVKLPLLNVVTTPSALFEPGKNTQDTLTPDEYGQMVTLPAGTTDKYIPGSSVSYQSTIYYLPDTPKPKANWEYMTYKNRVAKDWNDGVAKSIFGGMSVSVSNTDPVKVTTGEFKDYYSFVSTMTITNPTLDMYDSNTLTKYFFRCSGQTSYETVRGQKGLKKVHKWGGLAMDYSIELQHNGVLTYGGVNDINGNRVNNLEGIVNATQNHQSSVWKYPNLTIKVPQGKNINTAIIYYGGNNEWFDSRDKIEIDRQNIEARGVTISEHTNHKLVLVSNSMNSVSLATWHEILRNYVSFRAYEKVDYSNGASGGGKINWVVDEKRYAGLVIDPNTGHAYKFVHSDTPLSWDTAKANAEAYNSEMGMNGYLATITSDTEQNIAKSLVGNNEAWLGGDNTNGYWRWVDGSPWSYNGWKWGSDQSKKYLYMEGQSGWNSTNGTETAQTTYTFRNKLYGANYKKIDQEFNGGNVFIIAQPNEELYYTIHASSKPYPNGHAWITNDFSGWNYSPLSGSPYRLTPADVGDIIPAKLLAHRLGPFIPTQYQLCGTLVYFTPVDFDQTHIYYTQIVVDSYGDNNGRLAGGLRDYGGWVGGSTWLQDFDEGSPSGGGVYQEIEHIYRGISGRKMLNIFNTAHVKQSTNIQWSPDAQCYQYGIFDLTEIFGSNDNLSYVMQGFGYDVNNDAHIKEFMKTWVNNPYGEYFKHDEDSISGHHVKGIRAQKDVDFKSQVRKDIYNYVVEYDIDALSMRTTNHSATDNDRIGTNASANPAEKKLNVYISGNTKIYDKQQISPKDLIVTGSIGADVSLVRVTYSAPEVDNFAGYTTKTVNGRDWRNTGAVNATRYHATVSLTPEARAKGWTIDTANSQTECDLIIYQRPVNVYSYGNNKVYDGTSNGTIKNITFEPKTQDSGIVAGDIVRLNKTTVSGTYLDNKGRPTIHNSETNNGGKEYTMHRDPSSKDGKLFIVHDKTSDKFHNYKFGTEKYTGGIGKKGLYVHSLYMEDRTNPRNIKEYDGLNTATVSDIIIDGIVKGDDITLTKETLSGIYATVNAGEKLDSNGKPLPDRFKKLTENKITLTEKAELANNKHGDYFIEKEAYSGAIYRALLEAKIKSWVGTYGTGMEENPWHDKKPYSNRNHGEDSWLNIGVLKNTDTLQLDNQSYFEVEGLGKNAKVEPSTPVGSYRMTYKGLNENNYPVLSNYFVNMYDGKLEVQAREIVVAVNDSDKIVGSPNPIFNSTFYIRQNDDTLKKIGNDYEMDYKDMILAVPQDNVQNTIKIWSSNAVISDLTMKEERLDNVLERTSNIPYITDCKTDSEPIYNLGGDYTTHKCEWCENYHGVELGTDHWTMGAYDVHINGDTTKGNILKVAFVTNALGQEVQNYSLVCKPGALTVHPELRFQLEATVPMYVCMYGYRSSGDVVEPTNYGITNYSNGAIEIKNINISNDGWQFMNTSDSNTLKQGQLYMNMNNTVLMMGDNKPENIEDWRINRDLSKDGSGTFFNIPLEAVMAGGNVNEEGCHFVGKVTYTIGEYGLTVPTGVIDDDNVTIIDGKPVNPIW